jgi:uncharacterized protein (TIGR02118 family)
VLKFVVVCHRRPDWSREEFRRYFQEVHGPLAEAIPGLRRYVQSFAQPEPRRDPPWDAVIELWFDDRAAMEAAWQSEAGQRATADNANCMDLERTAWSVVDEVVVRPG